MAWNVLFFVCDAVLQVYINFLSEDKCQREEKHIDSFCHAM